MSKSGTYESREVFKATFSQNQTKIFGFSVVIYSRPNQDLDGVPSIVNHKIGTIYRIQKSKLLRTGFEPDLCYPRCLATQLHASYSCPLLSRITFLFYYLIFIPCSE